MTTQVTFKGRIGNLARAIEKETDQSIVLKVMQDVEQFTSASNDAKKAAWLKGVIQRLEQVVGREKSIRIMEQCGRACCGTTNRKRAKQLKLESTSLEEFLDKLNQTGIGGGRLTLQNQHTITGGYDTCYCEQVKHTEEPFPTDTYCHCSAGWYKQLFGSALEKDVEVELVQSIISGAESCEFIIHIKT